MSTPNNATAVKAKNYSKDQELQIIAASPFDLEGAKTLGETMGKSYRSVIAKALSLECEYITKPPAKKRIAEATKAEIVSAISAKLDTPLTGLEKATVKALKDLLNAVTDEPEIAPAD